MRPVCAVLRVEEEGGPRLINLSIGDETEELARALVEKGAEAAATELEEPGVYRLRIEGKSKKPAIKVTRIADADETVAVATVHRDSDESVAIRDLRVSPGVGVELDEDAVEDALTEGVASCASEIPIGEERAIEIVIPE